MLCQFVNGLKKEQREILIRQDDLLRTPVVKRIATLDGEVNGPVGGGLDQSLLMSAEHAMVVVTGPVAVEL